MKKSPKKPRKLYHASEYEKWLKSETLKSQAQIDQRLANILIYGHFGDYKDLNDDISELRWKNGRRIYYAYVEELDMVLLLGGNKNGQDQDINQAKNIFKKYLKIRTQA